jgi:8-oxo-dGTP pyrophosphatase MutT (NUDIX family)
MTERDIRYEAAVVYQAAVVDARRLLLLYCVPRGETGFWILPGGGREAGTSPLSLVWFRGKPRSEGSAYA